MTMIGKFIRMDGGASSVEYGLLIALIATVVCASVGTLGLTVLNTLYAKVVEKFPT